MSGLYFERGCPEKQSAVVLVTSAAIRSYSTVVEDPENVLALAGYLPIRKFVLKFPLKFLT
jgi:hypothetical protein